MSMLSHVSYVRHFVIVLQVPEALSSYRLDEIISIALSSNSFFPLPSPFYYWVHPLSSSFQFLCFSTQFKIFFLRRLLIFSFVYIACWSILVRATYSLVIIPTSRHLAVGTCCLSFTTEVKIFLFHCMVSNSWTVFWTFWILCNDTLSLISILCRCWYCCFSMQSSRLARGFKFRPSVDCCSNDSSTFKRLTVLF